MDDFSIDDLFLVDMLFQAERDIRTLPEWHGARWTAALRNASHAAGLEQIPPFEGLIPLRSGTHPIREGEFLTVRLIIKKGALNSLEALSCGFERIPRTSYFSPQTIRFCVFCDPLTGRPEPVLRAVRSITSLTAANECQSFQLQQLDTWSIIFSTPARMLLPPHMKRKDAPTKERFCQSDFFSKQENSDKILPLILSRMRWQTFLPLSEPLPCLVRADLRDTKICYNEKRHIILNGIVGTLTFKGKPSQNTASILVKGQYTGAGKQPRFGMGFYYIPELRTAS